MAVISTVAMYFYDHDSDSDHWSLNLNDVEFNQTHSNINYIFPSPTFITTSSYSPNAIKDLKKYLAEVVIAKIGFRFMPEIFYFSKQT